MTCCVLPFPLNLIGFQSPACFDSAKKNHAPFQVLSAGLIKRIHFRFYFTASLRRCYCALDANWQKLCGRFASCTWQALVVSGSGSLFVVINCCKMEFAREYRVFPIFWSLYYPKFLRLRNLLVYEHLLHSVTKYFFYFLAARKKMLL